MCAQKVCHAAQVCSFTHQRAEHPLVAPWFRPSSRDRVRFGWVVFLLVGPLNGGYGTPYKWPKWLVNRDY